MALFFFLSFLLIQVPSSTTTGPNVTDTSSYFTAEETATSASIQTNVTATVETENSTPASMAWADDTSITESTARSDTPAQETYESSSTTETSATTSAVVTSDETELPGTEASTSFESVEATTYTQYLTPPITTTTRTTKTGGAAADLQPSAATETAGEATADFQPSATTEAETTDSYAPTLTTATPESSVSSEWPTSPESSATAWTAEEWGSTNLSTTLQTEASDGRQSLKFPSTKSTPASDSDANYSSLQSLVIVNTFVLIVLIIVIVVGGVYIRRRLKENVYRPSAFGAPPPTVSNSARDEVPETSGVTSNTIELDDIYNRSAGYRGSEHIYSGLIKRVPTDTTTDTPSEEPSANLVTPKKRRKHAKSEDSEVEHTGEKPRRKGKEGVDDVGDGAEAGSGGMEEDDVYINLVTRVA